MLDRVVSYVWFAAQALTVCLVVLLALVSRSYAESEDLSVAQNNKSLVSNVGSRPSLTTDTQQRTTLRLPVPDPNAPAKPTLETVLHVANESYDQVREEITDYTCVLVRRERVDGRLGPHEFAYAKVRNRRVHNGEIITPFSIYLKFLKPKDVAGREVLYVEGANDNEMLVRRGGIRMSFVTTKINPLGELAMTGNRHPITEFGLENLLHRLIDSAKHDQASACDVQLLPEAKIDGRPTTGIVVTHQSQQVSPEYYQARIFLDKELRVPVHYESYDWPSKANGKPELAEQYTYTNLVLNPGLTDEDFSPDNPEYKVK